MIGFRTVGQYAGGVESVVTGIVPHLADLGWKIDLFVRERYWTGEPVHSNVRVISLPALNGKHFEAVSHSAMSTLYCVRSRPPIVHYHAVGNGLFAFFPRLWRGRTVVTVHGRDWNRAKWGTMATWVLRAGEVTAMRGAHEVSSVSSSVARELTGEFRREVSFIPNAVDIPVDTGRIDPKALSEITGLSCSRYLFWIGRIVPEKRLDLVIRAFKEIPDSSIGLVIAGEAQYSEDCARSVMALAADDPRIGFVGARFGAEKDRLFRGACGYVLPSDLEGMPVALLEAMSYGLPCVVADLPELRDLGDDTSLLRFVRGDADDLRAKIRSILDDPHRSARMGRAARQVVRDTGGWRSVACEWSDVYDRVLSGVFQGVS